MQRTPNCTFRALCVEDSSCRECIGVDCYDAVEVLVDFVDARYESLLGQSLSTISQVERLESHKIPEQVLHSWYLLLPDYWKAFQGSNAWSSWTNSASMVTMSSSGSQIGRGRVIFIVPNRGSIRDQLPLEFLKNI